MAFGLCTGLSDGLGDDAGRRHVGARSTAAGAVCLGDGPAVAADAAANPAVRIAAGAAVPSGGGLFENAKRSYLGRQTEILILRTRNVRRAGSRVGLCGLSLLSAYGLIQVPRRQ